MDSIQAIAAIAGIGGIALMVLLIVFRDVLAKNFFPRLSRIHAYKIIRLLVILTFLISVIGLAAWTVTTLKKSSEEKSALGDELKQARAKVADLANQLNSFQNKTVKARYPNIEEIESTVQLDLTQWQQVSPEDRATRPISKAQWNTTVILLKAREGVDYYLDDYESSGLKPVVGCDHPYEVIENEETSRNRGETHRYRLLLNCDISKEPLFKEFTLRHYATFFNSFQGETADWAATSSHYPGKKLRFVVIFPKAKPFKTYELLAYPELDGQPRELFKGARNVIAARDHSRLDWLIENPRLNYVYRINWKW